MKKILMTLPSISGLLEPWLPWLTPVSPLSSDVSWMPP